MRPDKIYQPNLSEPTVIPNMQIEPNPTNHQRHSKLNFYEQTTPKSITTTAININYSI